MMFGASNTARRLKANANNSTLPGTGLRRASSSKDLSFILDCFNSSEGGFACAKGFKSSGLAAITFRSAAFRLLLEVFNSLPIEEANTFSARTALGKSRGVIEILTRTINGKLHEPLDRLVIDCPEGSWAWRSRSSSRAKGKMSKMVNHGASTADEAIRLASE